jgi:hypothetical protein
MVRYMITLPVQFIATRHILLTKDYQRLEGTIHNIKALSLFQERCVCTSVDGTSSDEQHCFRKGRRGSAKQDETHKA